MRLRTFPLFLPLRTSLLLLAALSQLVACAGESSREPLAQTWGLSVRMAVENQKLDPLPKGDQPVAGLDGVFAMGALDAYRKSAEPSVRDADSKIKPLQSIMGNKGGTQ